MTPEPKIKVAVGLGNPDPALAHTYHNVGRMAFQAFLKKTVPDETPRFENYRGLFSYAKAKGILFVEPSVYMNDSGSAVKAAVKMADAKPEAVVIFHDDSDLTVGSYKISRGQRAAGHHGVESVIGALRTNNFLRIRIGIRPLREKKRQKASEFVLKTISKGDENILRKIFVEIATLLVTNY